MKRFGKSLGGLILTIMAGLIGLKIYTHNNTSTIATVIDRINPLVKTETFYVKTPKKYKHKYIDAVSKTENFSYIQKVYNKTGTTRKIEYISFGRQLTPHKFLKIAAKGQNVFKWEEITEKDLPVSIRSDLSRSD